MHLVVVIAVSSSFNFSSFSSFPLPPILLLYSKILILLLHQPLLLHFLVTSSTATNASLPLYYIYIYYIRIWVLGIYALALWEKLSICALLSNFRFFFLSTAHDVTRAARLADPYTQKPPHKCTRTRGIHARHIRTNTANYIGNKF